MNTLALCGSSRTDSTNRFLLAYLAETYPQLNLHIDRKLHVLPLFHSNVAETHRHHADAFIKSLDEADAILISTPEYLHNIPAALKNAFEWCYTTGVLAQKPVLPICYTPAPPRGEKAMTSLLYTLEALQARVPGSLIIHHNEISFDPKGQLVNNDIEDLLDASIELL